jgi:hypothetical protein
MDSKKAFETTQEWRDIQEILAVVGMYDMRFIQINAGLDGGLPQFQFQYKKSKMQEWCCQEMAGMITTKMELRRCLCNALAVPFDRVRFDCGRGCDPVHREELCKCSVHCDIR